MDRKLCEDFERNPGVNPLTGRKIDAGGPTYRRIAALCAKRRSGGAPPVPAPRRANAGIAPSDCEKFAKDPRFNPVTGRAITKGGAVYEKLRKACAERRSPNAVRKIPSPKKAAPPKQTCLAVGLRQLSGTCWFNAGLNLLVLGGRAGPFFRDLSASARVPASAKFADRGACPRTLTKDLVLGYMRRVFHGDFSATPGGRYTKNHAARMLGKLGHIDGVDATGGKPLHGLMKILGVTVPKSAYTLVTGAMGVYETTDPAVKFAVSAPPGDNYYTWGNAPRKKLGKFSLDSVAIAIMFVDAEGVMRGHAIVGFFCGGFPYVFDSNRSTVLQIDWYEAMTDAGARDKMFAMLNKKSSGEARYGTFSKMAFPFYFYVRG